MKITTTFILLIIASLVSSCFPDDDINPDSDDPRDNINYTWDCFENSPSYGEQSFLVDISIDPNDSTQVILSNFYGLGTWSTIKANYSGNNLNIESQVVEGHSISGQGFVSSNYKEINWTYEVIELNKFGSDLLVKETVTAVFTR